MNSDSNQNSYGKYFLIQSNIILLLICIIFSLGFRNLGSSEIVGLLMVILPAELFLILVSIVTWKKKTIYKKEKVFNRPFSKNEWIGLVIGVVFLSTFSLIFLGAGVPFPATLVILSLMASFPLGLYSILFAPLVIVNYEANVYDNSETIMGYFFKYFYIVFFGLTYHVHCTLLKMPFLVNKLFAILYTGLVVWEAFMIILYFDL